MSAAEAGLEAAHDTMNEHNCCATAGRIIPQAELPMPRQSRRGLPQQQPHPRLVPSEGIDISPGSVLLGSGGFRPSPLGLLSIKPLGLLLIHKMPAGAMSDITLV